MKLSSFDMVFLTRELQFLVGAKVEKIFQDKDVFMFSFHVPSVGKQLLYISLPDVLCLSSFKPVFPERPPGMCMQLRKLLSNARIQEISQVGFDRILKIVFSTKTRDLTLLVELLPPGNLLLLDESGKILSIRHPKKFSDRSLLPNKPYAFPKSVVNPMIIDFDSFSKLVKESDKDSIVKTLAIDFSLGGVYAQEILSSAKIDFSAKDLDDDSINNLFSSLQHTFKKDISAVVSKNKAYPFSLIGLDVEKSFPTFNGAVAEVVLSGIEREEAKSSSGNIQQTKIDKVLSAQKKQLEKLAAAEKENQAKGEFIYEHYTEIKALLDKINLLRKENRWDEIASLVKKVDKTKGTIRVDIK